MTRLIRAVCFDLDGLMFNTEDVFEDVGCELLRRRGLQMTDALRGRMMGRRAPEALRAMIDEHGLADPVEALAAESWNLFFELAGDRLSPMPGLLPLLEELERRQLPRSVCTSSTRSYLDRILGSFDLLDRFGFFLTAEDVRQGKPHPEIYLLAAQRFGVDPAQMLVFEDSEVGTNAAAAAGAVVVSVPHRHTQHHDFSRATLVAQGLHDAQVAALLER